MALISEKPVMVKLHSNTYCQVSYIWLELNCVQAEKVSVSARLYEKKDDKESPVMAGPMAQSVYVGELDSNIFDPEMGLKAHKMALEKFPEFSMEVEKK